MQQLEAERIALVALGWIAGDPDLLGVFLGTSGASLDDLKAGAGTAEVQSAVLDFLLMDDAWVARFCADADLPPESLARARAALPGGADVHWT